MIQTCQDPEHQRSSLESGNGTGMEGRRSGQPLEGKLGDGVEVDSESKAGTAGRVEPCRPRRRCVDLVHIYTAAFFSWPIPAPLMYTVRCSSTGLTRRIRLEDCFHSEERKRLPHKRPSQPMPENRYQCQ